MSTRRETAFDVYGSWSQDVLEKTVRGAIHYFGSDNSRGCKEHLTCKLNAAIVKTPLVHITTRLVTLSMITNFLPITDLLFM